MKTKQFFAMALALALAFFFGGAVSCIAQTNEVYQQFALDQELANYLAPVTQTQIDQFNTLGYGPMNYFWNEYGNQIADLQEQAEQLVDGFTASQSPQIIGAQVGTLTSQQLAVFIQLVAKVNASNATLLSLLTPAQQAKLTALQNANGTAQQNFNLVGDAFYAGFFLSPISPDQFGGMGGYPAPPSVNNTAPAALVSNSESQIRTLMNQTVTRIRSERAKVKAEAARKARFAGQAQNQ